MKFFLELVTLICVLFQVACSSDEGDDLVSCDREKFQKIVEKCKGPLCDIAQIRVETENGNFCGYRVLDHLKGPALQSDPSYEEVKRREEHFQPCTKYNKVNTLLSKNYETVEGPFTKEERTPSKAPPAVRSLEAGVDENQSISLAWQRPETLCEIKGYDVIYKYTNLTNLQEHTEEQIFFQSQERETEQHSIKNIYDNALYEICVAAQVEEHEGKAQCCKVLTREKAKPQPPPPYRLLISNITKTSMEVTWDTPDTGVAVHNFKVYVTEERDPHSPVTTHRVAIDTLPYTIQNLLPGTRYRIGVRAVGESGPGEEAVDYRTTEEEQKHPLIDEFPSYGANKSSDREIPSLDQIKTSGFVGNDGSMVYTPTSVFFVVLFAFITMKFIA